MALTREFRLIGASLAAAALALGSASGATNWQRLDTPQFTLLSDASSQDMVNFAVQYGAFRRAFDAWLVPDGARTPPSTLLLFRRQRDFRRYARTDGKDLFSYTFEEDNRAVLALAVDGDRYEALKNTFLFDTMFMLPRVGVNTPLWIRQGTGEVFSTLELAKGRCVIGREVEGFTEMLRKSRSMDAAVEDLKQALPWDRVLSVSYQSAEYKGDSANPFFFAQAWAAMRFVLLGGPSPRDRFRAIIDGVHLPENDLRKLTALSGAAPAHLLDFLVSSAYDDKPASLPFDEAAFRGSLRLRPAPEGDVHALLAELLVASGNTVAGDAELDQTAARAHGSAAIEEALARREIRRGHPDEAAAAYRAAIADGSTDPDAYLWSARRRMDQYSRDSTDMAGAGGDDMPEAIDEIRHGLALMPHNPQAYQLLGRAYYLQPTVTAEQANELTAGITADADGLWVRYYRGLLLQRLGQTEAALADFQALMGLDLPHRLRRAASDEVGHLAFELDRQKVTGLAQQSRFDEAAALIAPKLAIHDADTANYERLSDWLEHDRVLSDQQQVSALARAKQFDQAHALVASGLARGGSNLTQDAYRKLDAFVRNTEAWNRLVEDYRAHRWEEAKTGADALLAAADLPPAAVRQVTELRERAAARLESGAVSGPPGAAPTPPR